MKSTTDRKIIRALFAAYVIAILFPGPARAEVTDLAQVPLANSPSTAVLPNLMFILDDSGSMQWDYMPDNVHNLTTGQSINNCKTTSGGAAQIANTQCASPSGSSPTPAEPPYYTAQFNQIYYNPDITYSPGTDYTGVSLGSAVATAANFDQYVDNTPVSYTHLTLPTIYSV